MSEEEAREALLTDDERERRRQARLMMAAGLGMVQLALRRGGGRGPNRPAYSPSAAQWSLFALTDLTLLAQLASFHIILLRLLQTEAGWVSWLSCTGAWLVLGAGFAASIVHGSHRSVLDIKKHWGWGSWAWLLYSACLCATVAAVVKLHPEKLSTHSPLSGPTSFGWSGGPAALRNISESPSLNSSELADGLVGEAIPGPHFPLNLFVFAICLTSVIFFFFVLSQNYKKRGRSDGEDMMALFGGAMDIFDTSSILGLLWSPEGAGLDSGLRGFITTMACLNLLLPAFALLKQDMPKSKDNWKARATYAQSVQTLGVVAVNVPFLGLRLHLWSQGWEAVDMAAFVVKNVASLVICVHGWLCLLERLRRSRPDYSRCDCRCDNCRDCIGNLPKKTS